MLKAIKSKVFRLNFLAPWCLDAGFPTLNIAGMGISVPMLASRPSNVATSISNDRRILTLETEVIGLKKNEELKAFIITSNMGEYPIEITGVVDGVNLVLAEPLSREVQISETEPCDIQFSAYYYEFTPNTLGLYTYGITYTALDGSTSSHKDVIKVVNRPFDTGLSHTKLLGIFPSLAAQIQRNQEGFTTQIKSALEVVILKVRGILAGSTQKLDEDSILNPESLLNAHAYYAGALIQEGLGEWETANQYRMQGDALLELAMQSVALDLNGDGEITNDENLLKKKGGKSLDLGGNFNRQGIDMGFNPKRSTMH